jgi:hypothetical protein
MNRDDNEKLTSWYLSLIFSGASPEEAAAVIEEVRAEIEAQKVPLPAG